MSPDEKRAAEKRAGELLDQAERLGPGTHRLSDGTTAIVCGRGARTLRCSGCGQPGAGKLCDYPVVRMNGNAGTCDRPLCERCAISIGPGRDFCPPHHRYEQKRSGAVRDAGSHGGQSGS